MTSQRRRSTWRGSKRRPAGRTRGRHRRRHRTAAAGTLNSFSSSSSSSSTTSYAAAAAHHELGGGAENDFYYDQDDVNDNDHDYFDDEDDNDDDETYSLIEDEFILRGDLVWDEEARRRLSSTAKYNDLARPILDSKLFEVQNITQYTYMYHKIVYDVHSSLSMTFACKY